MPLVNWKEYRGRKPNDGEIRKWIEDYWCNGTNIGIVCGRVSGNLVVIDFDNDAAWADFLKWWKEHRPDDIYAVTPVVKTPRGHHVYLRCRYNVKQGKLASGIDIKAEGGFVVAPPSVGPIGGTYRFVRPNIGIILEVNDLSEVGIDTGSSTATKRSSNSIQDSPNEKRRFRIQDIMDGVPEGQRDDACFRYALYLKAKGLTREDTLDCLINEWAPKCTPPFPEEEVAKCVKSAYSYEDSELQGKPQEPQRGEHGHVRDLKDSKYEIRSGDELINNPVPKVEYRIQDQLRADGGRMALVGPYKAGKSLLAHDLAFKLIAGQEWLGFKTMKSNVLYVNLEVSKEKFQDRTQDFQGEYKYEVTELESFRETTVLDENLDLDKGIGKVQGIIDKCKAGGFKVDVLILDPRARLIGRSENEGERPPEEAGCRLVAG